MCRWKNFENRSIFGEDMDKSMWLSFFGPHYLDHKGLTVLYSVLYPTTRFPTAPCGGSMCPTKPYMSDARYVRQNSKICLTYPNSCENRHDAYNVRKCKFCATYCRWQQGSTPPYFVFIYSGLWNTSILAQNWAIIIIILWCSNCGPKLLNVNQGRINHLVGPTHSTTAGPHWKARRLKRGGRVSLSPAN